MLNSIQHRIIMKNILLILAIFLSFTKIEAQDKTEFIKLEKAVLAGGIQLRAEAFPSKYITPRPVDVWLPENYSKNKKYAVLYMHDGQNLFDGTTTWNKQEWKVDEWATKLVAEGKIKDIIVVGIHNIPKIRWQDLYPEKAMEYMDDKVRDSIITEAKKVNFDINLKGDEYLKFLVKELKPIIDKTFSVYTDKENTFVAGSSMGGLMSMYAAIEYPDVFGGAACFSTHWPGAIPGPNNPHGDAIFSYMADNLEEAGTQKFYFDYGNQTLDKHYPKFAPQVNTVFEAKNYSESDFKNLFFEGTDHSENSWNKRMDIPLIFLLAK